VSVRAGFRQKAGAALWRRPWLRGALTLSPPLLWFLVIYLTSLVVMLITAFFSVNSLTGNVVYQWTWSNFSQIFTQSVYGSIILRTLFMAILVTITDALIALPFAFYLAKVAGRRWRQLLLSLLLMPLWASYLAKVYAWINILSNKGVLPDLESHLGLPHHPYCLYQYGHVDRLQLSLAAVHDRPYIRGLRAGAQLPAGGLIGPGCRQLADISLGNPAHGAAGHRRGLNLHLFADPGRFHHAAPNRGFEQQFHWQRHLRQRH
jgi:hypothetical protein